MLCVGSLSVVLLLVSDYSFGTVQSSIIFFERYGCFFRFYDFSLKKLFCVSFSLRCSRCFFQAVALL